jgi:hypothetical protein
MEEVGVNRVGTPFVDHARAPLPAWVVPAIVTAAAVAVVVMGIATVTATHRARAAEQAVCTARLEAFLARNPVLRNGTVHFADDCATLRAIAP